ncbi:MAG: WG repeat-containing protein [Odoribacter splanchnicus]
MIITDAWPFIEERAIVWVKNTNFPDDYSCCKEKCGLIDVTGKFVIPPIYDNMQYIGGSNVAVNIGFEEHERYQMSGEWGVVNIDNQILIPLKYTEINLWENNLFAVEYDGKWGVINSLVKTIIPFEYDYISSPDEYGYIQALKNGKYGCIAENGKILIPFIYDDMLPGKELIPVKYGQQSYYINRDGNRVLL